MSTNNNNNTFKAGVSKSNVFGGGFDIVPSQDATPNVSVTDDGQIIINPYENISVSHQQQEEKIPTPQGMGQTQTVPTLQGDNSVQAQPSQDMVEIPVQDEPVGNINQQLPITLPNSVIPQTPQYVPSAYTNLEQFKQELSRPSIQDIVDYYSADHGFLEPVKYYRTGNNMTDFQNAAGLTLRNTLSNIGQLATGAMAAPALGYSAVKGLTKLNAREGLIQQYRQKGINVTEEQLSNVGLGMEDPDIQVVANAVQPIAGTITDIQKGMPIQEAYNKNIGDPMLEILDYSVFSPKLIKAALDKDITPQQYFELAANRLIEHPLDNALDIGTAILATHTPVPVAGLGKLLQMGKFRKAAQITSDLAKVKTGQVMEPVYQSAEKVAKLTGKDTGSLAKVIQSAEEGGVNLTSKEKQIKSALKEMMDKYHQILTDKGLDVDPMLLTASQYITRKTGLITDEAMKSVLPFLENREFVNYKPSVMATGKYLSNLYKKLTGNEVGRISKGIYEDASQIGSHNKQTGKIDVSKANAAPHELVHKILREASLTPNTEAQNFINEIRTKVFKDASKTDFGEVMSYALDSLLGRVSPEQLRNMNIQGVHPDSELFKNAVSFWQEELLADRVPGQTQITEAGKEYIRHNSKINPSLPMLEEAIEGYNKGDLFPVTHVDAGKERLISEGETQGLNRFYHGKQSWRVNGKATYEEIADMFNSPNYMVNKLGTPIEEVEKLNQVIKASAETIEGTPNQINKDTVWVNPESIKENNIKIDNLLDAGSEVPTATNNIPVNRKFIDTIKEAEQISSDFSSPFKQGSGFDKYYKFMRKLALGTGIYLSGNVQSSAYQTLMNSTINLARDLSDAYQTGGTLSRIARTSRPTRPPRYTAQNTIGKLVERVNEPISTIFQNVDAKQQNLASEIAINNYLSERGIPLKDRVNYLKNLDDINEINNIVERAQDAAGLNTSFSLIPKNLRPFVATVDPFWRWKDTAVRATARGIKRQPILSNLVLHKGLGLLAFDQEMQNRMGVNANIDIPAAHVSFNPKTGRMYERSAILSPQAQALDLASSTAEAAYKGSWEPLKENVLRINNLAGLGALNVLEGKDPYGNPLYNEELLTDYKTGKRYKRMEDGSVKEVPGTMKELVNQAIRSTVIPVRLLDTTGTSLLQTAADLAGYDSTYFRGQGVPLGSFNPDNPNINPNSPQTVEDAEARLMGMYTKYLPEKDYNKLSPRDIIRLEKSRGRGINKRLINRNIYGGRT